MIGRPLSGRPLAGRRLGGRALAFSDGQSVPGKGAGIAWRSRGLIASRMSDPFAITGAYSAGGTNTQITENARHIVAVDATNPSVVFRNVRNGTDGPAFTVKCGLATTLYSASPGPSLIAYAVTTWAGGSDSLRRSPSIAAGAYLESNQVSLSGLSAGNLVYSRQYEIFAAAPTYWLGSEISIQGTGDETGEVGTALTDTVNTYVDYGGGVYYGYPSGGGLYQFSSPSLILGDTVTRKARICLMNDSIGMGSGEGSGGLFIGWLQRLLNDDYPWYMVGNQGYSFGALLATDAERNRRLALLDLGGITHVVVQAITNDLAGGATDVTFLAYADALQAYLNTLPLKPKVVLCTSTPRTNAANNAKADGDGAAVQANRLTLNAAIRAQSRYAVFDAALYSQSAGDNNLWDTTGGKGTSDGIHPNATTHAAIATGLASVPATAFSVAHYV